MTGRARLGSLASLLALSLAATALAQDVPIGRRRIGVHWEDGVPHLDFSARDLITDAVRDGLRSGFWRPVVMRTYAYRENGQLITVTARSCRVYWDPWERDYTVEVDDSQTEESVTLRFRTVDGVARRCLAAQRAPIGRAEDFRRYAGERIYFAVIAEYNPLSPDAVQRIRRWLARSGGARAGEEAFFGPMVSVFINRHVGSAERTLHFRSQLEAVPR